MEIDKDIVKRKEEEAQKFLEAEQKKKEEIQKIKELACSWCKEWIIIEEIIKTEYWQCVKCGYLFCYDCAHQTGEFNKLEKKFVKCLCNKRNINSVWERKTIDTQNLNSSTQ